MNIEIIDKKAEIAVAIKKKAVRFDSMGVIMGGIYQKLFAHIAKYMVKQGMQMAGVPYCKYTNGRENFMLWDIELGVPVSEPLPEQGEICMSKTCDGKAICATHKGAYKDIEKTYAPMMEYLAANNLESTGVYYDYYLNDPSDTPESELLTKVVFPIKCMYNAVEFVSFNLKKGTSVSDFLIASDKINKDFLSLQKGYISRKLLVNGGLWADWVLWKTMDDALNAAKSFEGNAAAYEYFSFLDDKSTNMRHFSVKKDY